MLENQNGPSRNARKKNMVPALVLGLAIGWLVGLSVSETVSAVIAAVLGLAGGVGAGVLRGRVGAPGAANEAAHGAASVDLWPVALIAFGVAVGATAGLHARGQAWFASSDPARRQADAGSGTLYAVSVETCLSLMGAALTEPENLRGRLSDEFDEIGRAMAVADDTTLRRIVEALCPDT